MRRKDLGIEAVDGRNRIVLLEEDRAQIDPRRPIEGGGEALLKDAAACAVGARLEGREDTTAGETLGDGFEGGGDRGRMVGEVVDDRDLGGGSDDFLAAG